MKFMQLISCLLVNALVLPAFAADSVSCTPTSKTESTNETVTSDSPTDLEIPLWMQAFTISISDITIPLYKSPVTAMVITQTEIACKGYRHISDILKNTPGIYLSNLAPSESAVTEIYVRGISANNKIMVLVDGIKVKSPTGEPVTFLETIPLLAVKQVEITFGAASSIYGVDAMLATINIVTLDSAKINGVQIKATGGTVDTGEVQLVAGTKIGKDLSVMLAGSFHRSAKEDLTANYPSIYGNTPAVDLSDQNYNVDFKIKYKDLTLSYYRLHTKTNSSTGFNPGSPQFYDYSGASVWENVNETVNASYVATLNEFWQTHTRLSYENNEILPQSSYNASNLLEHKAGQGEALRFTQNVLYAREKINWLTGMELTFLKATPKHAVEKLPSSAVTTRYQNYAVYSQLNYAWSKALSTYAALRLDSDSRYSPIINPRLGFSWQVLTNLRFFGAWGNSYLTPSPNRIYQSWGANGGAVSFGPSLDLQPEKLNTSELGLDFIATKNTQLKLSGFYTVGTDLIHIVQHESLGGTVIKGRYENVASSKTYGMQTIASGQFDNGLNLNLDYTLTLGKQNAENFSNGRVGITSSPRHLLKSTVGYSYKELTFRLTGRWFDTIGTHENNPLYYGKNASGALVFDSNLHYAGQLNTTQWSVDLGVDNLLNKKYYTILQNDNVDYVLPRAPQETRKFYVTFGIAF